MFIFHIKKLIVSKIDRMENHTINRYITFRAGCQRKKLKEFRGVIFMCGIEDLSKKWYTFICIFVVMNYLCFHCFSILCIYFNTIFIGRKIFPFPFCIHSSTRHLWNQIHGAFWSTLNDPPVKSNLILYNLIHFGDISIGDSVKSYRLRNWSQKTAPSWSQSKTQVVTYISNELD